MIQNRVISGKEFEKYCVGKLGGTVSNKSPKYGYVTNDTEYAIGGKKGYSRGTIINLITSSHPIVIDPTKFDILSGENQKIEVKNEATRKLKNGIMYSEIACIKNRPQLSKFLSIIDTNTFNMGLRSYYERNYELLQSIGESVLKSADSVMFIDDIIPTSELSIRPFIKHEQWGNIDRIGMEIYI